MKKTRKSSEIIKELMATDLKIYGQEISKMIPTLLNDETKIPHIILGQDVEFHALNDASQNYDEEFKCKIEVRVAENSKEPKARQAMPGKAAILVE